jgi:hypothetical protein
MIVTVTITAKLGIAMRPIVSIPKVRA